MEQELDGQILSMEQRMRWLAEIVRGEGNSTGDKLKAIDMMNKMQQVYGNQGGEEVSPLKLEQLL